MSIFTQFLKRSLGIGKNTIYIVYLASFFHSPSAGSLNLTLKKLYFQLIYFNFVFTHCFTSSLFILWAIEKKITQCCHFAYWVLLNFMLAQTFFLPISFSLIKDKTASFSHRSVFNSGVTHRQRSNIAL